MSSSNLPNLLRSVPVFTENPWVRVIDLLPEVVIEAPVTVEVWFSGVNQPDIEPSLSVVGQTITIGLTVEQNRLLPSKGASINVKFDDTYVFQQELVPTKKGGTPENIVEEYDTPGLGIFRVSYFSSLTNASLAIDAQNAALASATIATTQATIATNAAADVNTRFGALLNDFGTTLTDPSQIEWINTGGTLTATSVTGGAANASARTITISNGSSGANASLEWQFDYSNLDYLAINDPIQIRLKLTESDFNTIASDTVVITMTVNDNPVDISGYTFTPYGDSGLVFEVIIPRVVGSLTEVPKIKVAIKSDAPTQSPGKTITWDSLGYYSDKYLFTQGVNQIAQTNADFYTLFPHQELASTYAIMDGGGVTDITSWLQDYIADAVAKSGRVEFKRNAQHYVGTKVDILGGLEMHGHGASFIANNSEIFTVKTTERLWAHHMMLRRNNTSLNATSFKFDPGYTNEDSVLEQIYFYNLPNHLPIDYVKRLKVRDCRFVSGQQGVVMGAVAQDSASDVELLRNIFDTVFLIGISSATANNVTIGYNTFGKYSASAFYGGRCVQVAITAGTHKNLQIVGNNCEAFTEYAYRIAVSSGATLDRVQISGGSCRDESSSTISSPMRITTSSGGVLTDLNVSAPLQLVSKYIGIDIDAVTNAMVTGVNIRQHTGTFASARGMSITNSTYLPKGNTCVGFPGGNPNLFTGSTLLTEN